MKNKIYLGIIGVLGLVILMLLSSNVSERGFALSAVQPPAVSPNNIEFNVYPLNLPSHMTFAGESVPLNDFEVRERIDRELMVNTYWHSNTLRLIKLSHRFFPVIEQILKENDVPEDFKYVALAESGLENATSSAGAKGYWQFLKSTAQSYGLEVNSEVDERYHIEKSTKAACKYFKKAKEKFGSYTMAAASYNMGINGLQKQVDRQRNITYYDLLLNTETSRYVPRILAFKEIVQNPAQYGFKITDEEKYPPVPFKEVKVNQPVNDLASFAFENQMNYKLLKFYNPWLRDNKLTNKSRKTYYIKVPI